jgi:hypothetical protein
MIHWRVLHNNLLINYLIFSFFVLYILHRKCGLYIYNIIISHTSIAFKQYTTVDHDLVCNNSVVRQFLKKKMDHNVTRSLSSRLSLILSFMSSFLSFNLRVLTLFWCLELNSFHSSHSYHRTFNEFIVHKGMNCSIVSGLKYVIWNHNNSFLNDIFLNILLYYYNNGQIIIIIIIIIINQSSSSSSTIHIYLLE